MLVAVLSDIHANLVALEAVLADAGRVDAIWHLGDVVGYGPEPDAVVARLAAIGAIGVLGNHDAVAIGAMDAGDFNPDARRAAEWTRDTISAETRAWLEALPLTRTEGDFTLVHGSPRDPIWEYITTPLVASANLDAFATTHCLHGHTHIPVAFRSIQGRMERADPGAGAVAPLGPGRSLTNPGSVGQPRDGDPRASYAVLDTERAEMRWHRVAYDIGATQAGIRAKGLPSWLADRLAIGG